MLRNLSRGANNKPNLKKKVLVLPKAYATKYFFQKTALLVALKRFTESPVETVVVKARCFKPGYLQAKTFPAYHKAKSLLPEFSRHVATMEKAIEAGENKPKLKEAHSNAVKIKAKAERVISDFNKKHSNAVKIKFTRGAIQQQINVNKLSFEQCKKYFNNKEDIISFYQKLSK